MSESDRKHDVRTQIASASSAGCIGILLAVALFGAIALGPSGSPFDCGDVAMLQRLEREDLMDANAIGFPREYYIAGAAWNYELLAMASQDCPGLPRDAWRQYWLMAAELNDRSGHHLRALTDRLQPMMRGPTEEAYPIVLGYVILWFVISGISWAIMQLSHRARS